MRGVAFSLFVSFWIFVSTSAEADRIYLKSGWDFEVRFWWEEGDMVLYERYGGVVGVPKRDVDRIERTGTPRVPVIRRPPGPIRTEERDRIKPVSIESPAADRHIKDKCGKDWKANPQLQAMCAALQYEALALLREPVPLVAQFASQVRDSCARQWPLDFRMRAHCEHRGG